MASVFSSTSVFHTSPLRGLVLALSLWLGAAVAFQTDRLPSVCAALLTPDEFYAVSPAADYIIVRESAGVPPYQIPGPMRNVVDTFHQAYKPLTADEHFGFQCVIARQSISEDMRPNLNIIADVGDEGGIIHVCNALSADLATAFEKSLDDGFADCAAPSDSCFTFAHMHVAGFPADECLINFDIPGQLAKRTRLHREPDTVEHEPRRFLGYVKCSREFTTAYAVLSICNAPDGDEPLVESQRRVLEDRADLYAELLTTVLGFALQQRPGPDDSNAITTAFWADDFPVWPLSDKHGFKARFWFREVTDGG